MKNLQTLKKFAAIVVSAMMVLSTLALPTFAATGFTVSNVQKGATVKAYKIIEQKTDGSLDRVEGLTKTDIVDLEAPTTKEITDLAVEAQKASGSKLTLAKSVVAGTGDTAEFTGLTAGTYLVLIENAEGNTKIYNPLLIAVDKDGNAVTAVVGSGDFEKINGAVAKVSDVPFNKEIARGTDANANKDSNKENDKTTNDGENAANYGGTSKDTDKYADSGDTAGKTNTVWFKITSAFPTYADNYSGVKFIVHDELSEGLTMGAEDEISVYIEDTQVPVANYELTREDDGFVLSFKEEFIKSHGNVAFEVRYPATVDEDCDENFDPETNTGWVEYTNAPGQEHTGEKITTYHYTFTINGQINGPDSGENREAVKVGVDEFGDWVIEETTWETQKGWKPLAGAKFGLYTPDQLEGDFTKPETLKVKSGKTPIREAVSRADGMLMSEDDDKVASLDRLDCGTYYLVEMEAPSGYAENKTAVPVVIEATLGEQGILTAYKITIGGVVAGDYSVDPDDYDYDEDTDTYSIDTTKISRDDLKADIAHYTKNAEGKYVADTENTTPFDEAADLANSKIGTLPSTGGMGTVLFTVGGIAIMALAIFLLFGGKKKQEQK
jgi:fimbrial isopeptide formation D2 family protein/LPXTG-motif cell wall-anchored protein